jgi:hypothetical protein
MKKIFTTSILLGCIILFTTAQVIHVPGDQPSIQAGINAATDGDTVLVADSTYYENINFRGKAITVASYFLVDGDTSHISKTIIDGSQPFHPDTASVVSMVSGEDTTSVLYGFTITAGKGTHYYWEYYEAFVLCGGGVNIFSSGGKIERNIIGNNHLPEPKDTSVIVTGFGINAMVTNNHTAIIRKNIIRNNSFSGNARGYGGGILLGGGKLIVEDNVISDNNINSLTQAFGGGIIYYLNAGSFVIPKVIITNNVIAGNELSAKGETPPEGAGICLTTEHHNLDIKICNNLIYNNRAHDGWGGGIDMSGMSCKPVIVNNTIVNNYADLGGEQIYIYGDNNYIILLNNILWSESEDGINEIDFEQEKENVLIARYNNIRNCWEGEGNIDADPGFMEGSYDLDEGSLCIGRGVASIKVDGTWYFAPGLDLKGALRPDNSADQLVDMGAIESGFYKSKPLIMPNQWFFVNEHSSVIGTLYFDTTAWYGDSVSYSIIAGDLGNIFEINSATREILVPDPSKLDYEDTAYHNLIIRVEYSVASGTTIDTGEIHIVLADIGDTPPVVFDTTFYIDKNIPGLTPLGYVRAVDPDSYLSWKIIDGNLQETFEVKYPGRIRIMKTDTLECEYILTIVVTELEGLFQSDTAIVIIRDTISQECWPESVQAYNDLSITRIYPNPANDRLNIEWPDVQPGILDVEIINITGRTIYRKTGHIEQIDVSGYARGLYLVKVRAGDKLYTGKVILQ